jgi:hypothetical protein
VHHGKFWLPMSALGQKRSFRNVEAMSALPPKADIGPRTLANTEQLTRQASVAFSTVDAA